MDTLYPSLRDLHFRTVGLCSICFMEMELTPRYSCINGHTVCHRCKPYYYCCLVCAAPLDVETLPPQMNTFRPVDLPHPMSPCHDDLSPSAPSMNDFLSHEKKAWEPPVPSENHHLESCSYSDLGCWVKIPEHLRVPHESRYNKEFLLSSLTYDFRLSVARKLRAFINTDVEIIISGVSFDRTWRESTCRLTAAMIW